MVSRARKDDEEDHWIKSAVKKPGALHKELGIPESKKIPMKTIDKAAHSKNPLIKKRAILAKTFKNMKKG